MKTVYLIPIQNDYESAKILVEHILGSFKTEDENFILIVDDGSSVNQLRNGIELITQENVLIEALNQKSGHQNAIYFGLGYIEKNFPGFNVVILDGDGEDKAADAIELASRIDSQSHSSILLATRGTRDVSKMFRIGYFFFTRLFKGFTGKNLRSGNFMGIPGDKIKHVMKFPGIRLHVAAAVVRYEPDISYIEFNRGSRIAGKSRMNLASLVLHAYGAFSVFSDIVIARFCLFLVMVSLFLSTIITGLFILKVTNIFDGIPGWTSLFLLQIASTVVVLLSLAFIGLMLQLQAGLSAKNPKN